MKVFQRTIPGELQNLDNLMLAITRFLEEQGIDSVPVSRINLALEETITNTIKFGYADGGSHEVHVSLEIGEEEIVCVIEDDGREFNPLVREEIDPTASLENCRVGGLGIHLMKKLLDAINYRREGLRNILEIRVRKNPPDRSS